MLLPALETLKEAFFNLWQQAYSWLECCTMTQKCNLCTSLGVLTKFIFFVISAQIPFDRSLCR